jgi:cytochrome P450
MTASTVLHIDCPRSDVDPFSREYILNPYAYHEEFLEAGSLVWMNKLQLFFAPRYAECQAIVSDWQTFCSSAGVGLSNFTKEKPWRPLSLLLESDPPEHTRRRTVVGRVLSAPNLRGLRAGFEAEADKLIDRVVETGKVEVVADIAQAYILKVFPDAVGLVENGRFNLMKYGNMVFNAFGPRNDIFEESMKDASPVSQWVMKQCKRENLKPGGLGDQVYQAVAPGKISEDEALILVRSFLSAGVDTTVDAIGNALWCLATHPDQLAKMNADPSLARNAFEEVLRFDSPFQTFFRTTAKETEIGGVRIPANEKLMLSTGCANRDPRKWERPNEFDIERITLGHVGFGAGIHGCIGQMISRLEIETLLTQLAKRKVTYELIEEPKRRLNNTLHGFSYLPMRFKAN